MKKVLVTLGLVLLAVIATLAAVPAMLNTETLQKAFARQISSASGATIALYGPVKFSIIPDFGIVAEDFSISTKDSKTAISVQRAVAGVRLRGLLSGQIDITGIELEQPTITLFDDGAPVPKTTSEQASNGDIFQSASGLLERLTIDQISIRQGVIQRVTVDQVSEIGRNIDLELTVPDPSQPISATFSGDLAGKTVKANATIQSLRQLLQRRPTAISLDFGAAPAPHPALREVAVNGDIQLAADGSYRIEGGKITSLGQPMQFNALYVPGQRPYVKVDVDAATLNFAELSPSLSGKVSGPQSGPAQGPGVNLSSLADFDADIAVTADALTVGEARARGLAFTTRLKNDRLSMKLNAQEVAGGTLAGDLGANLSETDPEFRGQLKIASARLKDLAQLAGMVSPADGDIATDLAYAFRGTSASALRDTINVVGKFRLTNGEVRVPALGELAGTGAETITELDVAGRVENIEQPIDLSGAMAWNGEKIDFTATILPLEILSKKSGPAKISVVSRLLRGKFNGKLGLDGAVNGAANLTSPSLSKLLAWLGQDAAMPLGQFSYSGDLSAANGKYSIERGKITLEEITANGSASLTTSPKTDVRATLSLGKLDLARFTGGADRAGASNGGQSGDSPLDLSVLRKINAKIDLSARQIGYGKIVAGPAKALISIKNGIARLELPQAGFYGGQVRAEILADGSAAIPAIDLRVTMDNVDALPFLVDAAEFNRLEGRLNATIATKGAGTTTKTLARSLNGNSDIHFANGALRGIDVAKIISNLQTVLTSGFQENAADRTEFTEMSVTFDIGQGVAATNDLTLLGPLVRMDGAGQIDLADQTINMRLKPKLVGSLSGQGGEFDIAGLAMPVIVTGPLSGPRIYPDLANLLANPQATLQLLSKLKLGIPSLGEGKLDAKKIIAEKLGLDKLGGENAITNVLDQIGGNTDSETGGADTLSNVLNQLGVNSGDGTGGDDTKIDAKDAVGAVLQGLLRNKLPPAQDGQDQGGLGAEPVTGRSLDNVTIPLPVPNPRRQANTGSQPTQPTAIAETPPTITDQLVDQIAPKVLSKDQQDAASDLLIGDTKFGTL